MKLQTISLIPVFLIFISCSNNSDFSLQDNLKKQYPIAFTDTNINIDNIRLYSGLRANFTGDTVLFYSWITNKSANSIKVLPYLIELQTLEEYRCTPLNQTQEINVESSTSKFISYLFVPVNNKLLYQRTNYKGDLDSCYFVKLNFLRDQKGISISDQVLPFQIDKTGYENFKRNFSSDHLFTFYEMDEKNKLLINSQINYLGNTHRSLHSKHANSHLSMRFTETELMMNGIIVTSKLYHYKDSIYMNLRLVNHGNNYLQFLPDSTRISYLPHPEMQSKRFHASPIPASQRNSLILKKGDRYQKLINFGYCAKAPSEVSFNLSFLKYYPQNRNVFNIQPVLKKR